MGNWNCRLPLLQIVTCLSSNLLTVQFLLSPSIFLLLPRQQGHHPWLAKLRPKGSGGKTFSESSEDTTTCSQDMHCQIPQDCQRSTSYRCFLATGLTTTWSIVGRTKWRTGTGAPHNCLFIFYKRKGFETWLFF